MTDSKRFLLLTGIPGVGKTTVLREVADRLPATRLSGFYTEEIRERGIRQGFRLISFHGRSSSVIAHTDLSSTYRVGKYKVDVAAISEAAEILLKEPQADVYLLDEIGKMECMSDQFVKTVRRLTSQAVPLVATVSRKGGGFMAEMRNHPQAELWEVTPGNREEMPARILDWLSSRLPEQSL